MPLHPGDQLFNGQYRILRQIGRGGFGFVYVAEHALLGQEVAIKELIPGLVGDEAMLKRFLAEARATMRLNHDRIVRTHEVFSEHDNYYIAMEYMPGGSLEARLAAGPLPVEEAVYVAQDVAEGLAYAHEHGVVHCDLKPANILFAADGRAKVADFGIAHVSDQMLSRTWQTPAGFSAGTLPYMAPEQVEGVRDDPRVDIYALGAVLYRALTGRTYLEFDTRETPGAQMRNVQRIQQEAAQAPSALNRQVPAWLDQVVLLALAKDPEARFKSAPALLNALCSTGVRPGAPTPRSARTPPRQPPPTRPGRAAPALSGRRAAPWPWLAAGGAVLVLAVVAALAWPRSAPRSAPPAAPTATASATPAAPLVQAPATTAVPRAALRTATPLLSETPAPTFTPTPSALTRVVTSAAANLRSGPGTSYAKQRGLRQGEQLTVIECDAGRGWLRVRLGDGTEGWISALMTDIGSRISGVPIASAIPPTITVAPSATVKAAPAASVQTLAVSLQGVANASTSDGYVDPPVGDVVLGGVRFSLGQGGSVTTQAGPLPDNPKRIFLPVEAQAPQAVYLLLTGGDLYSRFAGQTVGRVRLTFSDGNAHAVDLVAGLNLREWKLGPDIVERAASSELTEVWRGANRHDTSPAVIDMLKVLVPAELQSQTLVGIEVADLSAETVGDLDPALNLLGVSVTVKLGPTSTPAAPSCRIAAGETFRALWEQQRARLGCALNQAAQSDATTERFQYGRMIWRKSNDMIYVLYDDGDWALYPDISVDGAPEPEGFQPPAGLYTPVRGFGVIWREKLGGTNARIGWATQDEYGVSVLFQDFEKGLMLEMEGRVHLLGDDGARWLAP